MDETTDSIPSGTDAPQRTDENKANGSDSENTADDAGRPASASLAKKETKEKLSNAALSAKLHFLAFDYRALRDRSVMRQELKNLLKKC